MGFAFAQPVREKGEESSAPSSSSYPVNKGVRIKKKKKKEEEKEQLWITF